VHNDANLWIFSISKYGAIAHSQTGETVSRVPRADYEFMADSQYDNALYHQIFLLTRVACY
jgi:hypothetical protein